MEFVLSKNELAYIQSEICCRSFYGIAPALCDKKKAVASLTERKLIYPVRGSYELCNELRLLFGSWNKVRYGMSRPDLHSRDFDIALLSDMATIIYFKREKDEYTIRYVDLDDQSIDFYMASCMQLAKVSNVENPYSVKLSVETAKLMFDEGSAIALQMVSKQTGLPLKWLDEYLEQINSTDYPSKAYAMVITEDLQENVGCLTRIVNTGAGIYAFKHITKPGDEKFVIIKGDTQFIVDCMNNF